MQHATRCLRFLTILLLAGLTLLVPRHLVAQQGQRPNILFLFSDDQRPDTIAALGNPYIETPNLDRLVRQGTTFTRATCGNPICVPSRAELLTGNSGFRNGVLDFGRGLKTDTPLWPETMQQAGYRTCYVGKWHTNGRPTRRGYTTTRGLFGSGGGKWSTDQTDWKGAPVTGYRGWVFQSGDGREKYPDEGVGLTGDISRKFADAAIEFMREESEQPFFLHVNFTAPHDPLIMPPGYEDKYDPDQLPLPANFRAEHSFDHGNFEGRDEELLPWPRTPEMVRRTLAMYYAVISDLDHQIGRILETLRETGQDRNTIVIFASDHGLGVGSHGLRGKQSMYEHTIGVPLIFAGPGIPKNEMREAQAYLRDLYPTVCDLVSITHPQNLDGMSLSKVIEGSQAEVHPYIVGYFRDKQRMIRMPDGWKLIHYPHLDRYQMFHLPSDPFELKNLAEEADYGKQFRKLRDELLEWQRSVEDPAIEKPHSRQ